MGPFRRNFLSVLLSLSALVVAQDQQISDLVLKLSEASEDTSKVHLLLDLSDSLYSSNQVDALRYSMEAQSLSTELGYILGEAYALKYIGLVNFIQGEYVQSAKNWEQALVLFEDIENIEGTANMLSNLGVIYNNQGNEARALELYLESLKLAREIQDTIRMITTINNIGLIYSKKVTEGSTAVEYFQEALDLSKNINYYEGIGTTNQNLGELYFNQGDESAALEYFSQALIAYRTAKSVNITNALTYLGKIYANRKEFETALRYQEESLEIAEQFGAKLEMARALLGIAETYYLSGEYDNSLEFSQRSLSVASEIDALHEKMGANESLARAYVKKGNLPFAYDHLDEAYWLKDSLFSEQSQEQINRLRIQYEIENMLQENEILKKDIQLREIRNKQQRIVILFMVLVFVVTVVFILMLFRENKQKRRANKILKEQNILISGQKQEITDSIQYAKSIQNALLTPHDEISKLLPEYFILFRPRDIVSGDFYWIYEIRNRVICVVADCTGHGVPGAFMSMLGISFLNEIMTRNPDINAGDLLDQLRTDVILSLRQSGRTGDSQDGMDITAIIIEKGKKQIQCAGANNSLILIRNGELIQYKADNMPIGIYDKADKPFTNHKFKYETGDVLYMFTDGFPDQFGGPLGKKFMSKNFKKLLTEVHQLPMVDQKKKLEKVLDEWMAETDQVDDILVMGIRGLE